jgi:hypothetical protein
MELPVHVEYKPGWGPQPLQELWRRENLFLLPRLKNESRVAKKTL